MRSTHRGTDKCVGFCSAMCNACVHGTATVQSRWMRHADPCQEFSLTCCADNIQHKWYSVGPITQSSWRTGNLKPVTLLGPSESLNWEGQLCCSSVFATKSMLDHKLQSTSELLAVRLKCIEFASQDGKISVNAMHAVGWRKCPNRWKWSDKLSPFPSFQWDL